MHSGHRHLINKLVSLSENKSHKSVLITFNPNPYIILNNINPKEYHIISREKKYNLIEKIGVDILLEINFNYSTSNIKAYDFLKNFIVTPFNPIDIVVGYDHHFGKDREGNASFLRKYQDEFNYKLHTVEPFILNKETASSSLIRKLILSGNLSKANAHLGRNYELSGVVTKGTKVGREMSFPTANIALSSVKQLMPNNGVYFIKAVVQEDSYYGMCNIGCKPTFEKVEERSMEVHLFNYNKYDLYDKYIVIEFVDYIRSEKKFDTREDLKKQLEKDKEYCMNILG